MALLLAITCWLLALGAAAPSTLLNVQLDPARPTQLYRAPSSDGGPGAWIITGSGPRRPTHHPVATDRRPASGHPPRPVTQSGSGGAATGWGTQGSASTTEGRPNRLRPSAGAGTTDWTQHNRVEEATGLTGAGKKPAQLPSFVITSRPFGFKGSSNSGQAQRRPATPSFGSGQSYSTSGQGHTASGQGYTTSGQSQRRPPISSYVRPTHPRPSVASGFNQPSSESFIFSSRPNSRPLTVAQRQPSSPTSAYPGRPAGGGSHSRPSAFQPVTSSSQPSRKPSGASNASGPSQVNSQLNFAADVSHDDLSLAEDNARPADVEPLAAPPSADDATSVTHKTAPDAVSTVGGKKLPTFNLGCRQGHRCSFIINGPAHVPQPTYTPYNKQAVDSYLQRFQTLLALSNSRRGSNSSSASTNTSKDSSLASASTKVVSIAAAPGAASASTGAASDIYNNNRATAVPSLGEAYRKDIWQAAAAAAAAAAKPMVTRRNVEPARRSAALAAQRYRSGTADLYRLMRSSPSTMRTVKPAEGAFAGRNHQAKRNQDMQWSPRGHREAKNIPGVDLSAGVNARVKTSSQRHEPGQKQSRYTVERVDPKTKTSYPTVWNSESHASSNVVPVSGTIFKAHLSSGPISFQSNTGVKQSRSEGSFKHVSAESNPRMASLITEDGVRELPNVQNREFRHRGAGARQYQPTGRSRRQQRLQMARETRHYVAPPSRGRSVWRWTQPALSSRRLHK